MRKGVSVPAPKETVSVWDVLVKLLVVNAKVGARVRADQVIHEFDEL